MFEFEEIRSFMSSQSFDSHVLNTERPILEQCWRYVEGAI